MASVTSKNAYGRSAGDGAPAFADGTPKTLEPTPRSSAATSRSTT